MKKSLLDHIVLCLLINDENQHFKLTPTRGCLKSILFGMNSFKISFDCRSTLCLTSKDCKNKDIDKIVVKHGFPTKFPGRDLNQEGTVFISVQYKSGRCAQSVVIYEFDDTETYLQCVECLIDYINEH